MNRTKLAIQPANGANPSSYRSAGLSDRLAGWKEGILKGYGFFKL